MAIKNALRYLQFESFKKKIYLLYSFLQRFFADFWKWQTVELFWVWVLKNKTISKNQHTKKKIIQREKCWFLEGKEFGLFWRYVTNIPGAGSVFGSAFVLSYFLLVSVYNCLQERNSIFCQFPCSSLDLIIVLS